MMAKLTAAVALMAVLGSVGCSAAITRRNGPTVVGVIDRSDPGALYVTVPDGPRFLIERSDVVDIDHPGKGLVVAGLAAVVAGIGMVALCTLPENPSGFIGIPRAMGWGSVLIGIPVTLLGGSIYLGSRSAAGSGAVAPGPSAVTPR